MIHIPVLRWGEPYKSLDVDKVVHFATGEAAGRGQPGQRRPGRARHAPRQARPRRAARDPHRRPAQDGQEGRRAVHRGGTAAGQRHADARAVRAHAVGHHRLARAHVPVQHEEEPLRAQRDGQDPRRADPRPGPEHPVARLRRRGARRAGQLPGAVAGAGAGAAEQLARAFIRCGCRSFRCRSAWCSSRGRRSRGRPTAWPRPSSRPACPSRPSPSIPASATSAPPCWRTARAA